MQIFDDSRPYNGRFIIRNGCSLRVELQVYHNRKARKVPKLLHWGLESFGIQTNGPRVDGVIDLEFYSKSVQENAMHVKSALLSAFGIARDVSTFNSIQRSASIIREWIANCDSQHTKCAFRTNGNAFPTRVLDVCQLRRESGIVVLVEKTDASFHNPETAASKQRYATLSHCWGGHQPLQTKRETFMQHRKGIAWKSLPLTFRDAISIVRALGIRYIWIDSLCIIQDDQDDWKKEAARMAIVYSNSYLNLAATGSHDSRGGFFYRRKLHLKNSTLSIRSHKISSIRLRKIDNQSSIFVRPSLEEIHHRYNSPNYPYLGHRKVLSIGTPLLTRAWVFQERRLAPRTIHFHPSELVMECKSGLRCECTGLEKLYANSITTESDLERLEDLKVFEQWFDIVQEYCKLSLTRPSDRLIALIGVASTFQDRLKCRYLAGLWQSDIARGLLWTLRGAHQSSNYTKNEKGTSKAKTAFASSWSWASAVFNDGGIITFPATQDSSFKPHECFSYISTNLPTTAVESLDFPETDIPTIRIQGLGVAGEITHECSKVAKRRGVTLNFGSYSATVPSPEITISLDFYHDFHSDHTANESTKIICVVVGTMHLRDPTTKPKTDSWICTLLCKLSSRRPEHYERVGVFDVREDTGIFQDADKMTIDLI
ncbi:uncharacterized protein EAE98_003338 [Botrytis deweyae]|uniref:Heterokaryon incompatibility domain-containing protein n=1 Tax=Botrytis deweyae TaxID=2478750 RepID=A0ABQ7ITB0_9HELO|nr:uncharacterized protein EAE98_003338 [Botrytis deweyae]KAF7933629.1 hypothetical protein EAE98_003338 [Botrytis deweyae]